MTLWQRIRRFFLTFLPAKTVRVGREMCVSCELFNCEDCYDVDQGWGCCCGRIAADPGVDDYDDDDWDEHIEDAPVSSHTEETDGS